MHGAGSIAVSARPGSIPMDRLLRRVCVPMRTGPRREPPACRSQDPRDADQPGNGQYPGLTEQAGKVTVSGRHSFQAVRTDAVGPMGKTPIAAGPDIRMAERLFADLQQATQDDRGITRMSYGPGEAIAHSRVRDEARALGLTVTADAALNLYITLSGKTRGPAIMIGSHLDSVPGGGNFDGAAGVLMGLAVLAGYRRSGFEPECDITVMAVRAEESTWFPASYIGSRAAFGLLRRSELDQVRRAGDGLALGQAIAAAGGDPDRILSGPAHLRPTRIRAFIEPHIEQGPVLVDAGKPVGIATGIRGSVRHRHACCHGSYAHSGATPRRARRDAVQATAALTGALDELWAELEAEGQDLSITVGQFSTDPEQHAFSKVAGRVDFALDCRSQSSETLDLVSDRISRVVADTQIRFRVSFELGPRTGTNPAPMDADVVDSLAAACASERVPALRMACGAGHDAAVFAQTGVPTGMLLIRNENGSHNPDEDMAVEDFAAAARSLSRYCYELAASPESGGQVILEPR